MPDITLEKTHTLLEQLAEYVMTHVSTNHEVNELRREMNEKLELKADKTDIQNILNGQDAQAQQLDNLSIDMKAVSRTLDIHEERLAMLEERVFGARVRDDQGRYKEKKSGSI